MNIVTSRTGWLFYKNLFIRIAWGGSTVKCKLVPEGSISSYTQWCHCEKKIIKEKIQLTRVGKPEGDVLPPCNYVKAQQEDSFLTRIQPMNSRGLCLLQSSQLPFAFYKTSSFSCHVGTYTHGSSPVQASHCYPLLTLNKPIFAGETSDCLFISGQHHQPAASFRIQKPLPTPSPRLFLAVLLVPYFTTSF